jgi:hypothetical protein
MIFFLCLYNSKNGCGALFLTGVPVERLLGSDVVASASGLDGARRYLRDPCRYGDECVGVGVDVDVGMGVGVHGGGGGVASVSVSVSVSVGAGMGVGVSVSVLIAHVP